MDLLVTGSNLLLIVAGFCILIAIHELGHFLAARWAGIRVHEFAIGMGPTVVSFRKGIGVRAGSTDRTLAARYGRPSHAFSLDELKTLGISETEYALRALPLGGFVKMLGQEDANPEAISHDPGSYQRTPIWKRMVVVSAGVIANIVLAVVLFLVAFLVGVRFPAPVAGFVPPDGPAGGAVATNAAELGLTPEQATGIKPGDRVVSIDGETVRNFMDIMIAGGLARPDRAVEVVVERPGLKAPLRFELTPAKSRELGLLSFGIGSAFSTTVTNERESRDLVDEILTECGAKQEGVGPGDRMTAVNGTPVSTAQELNAIVEASNGQPLVTTWVKPDGSTLQATIAPSLQFGALLPASELSRPEDDRFAEPAIAGLLPLVRVDSIDPSSANADVLQRGDVFLKVGSVDAPSIRSLRREIANYKGGTVPLVVLRDGRSVAITGEVNRRGQLGFAPAPSDGEPILAGAVAERAVASKAGQAPDIVPTPAAGLDVFPRSTIVRVAGTPVQTWADVRTALQKATDSSTGNVEVAIETLPPFANAQPETQTLRFSPEDIKALDKLTWSTPILDTFDPEFITLRASGPIEAISMGLSQTKRMALQVYLTLDRVLRRTVSIEQLNGPVGILHAGVKVADQGFMFLVFFLAAISVNLAVMNFLPLPIVDGGLFLFLIYEKIRGRPPSIAFQNAATAVGLVLIGSIFLITFFNDIRRLVG
ncbi:MAG: site-2 protease family protein [Phycisphaerae bacterium]|nr:site-2 protease family protein [Phycisphaerae bacterium]